jgi:hypothetical protein
MQLLSLRTVQPESSKKVGVPYTTARTWNGCAAFGTTARPAATETPFIGTSPPCMTLFLGGRPRAVKWTELAGLYVCSGWKCLIGKARSPRSFGAPPTRPRPTSELEASGLALCGTPPRTSRTMSRWTVSFAGRAASTNARVGSVGGWGEVRHAAAKHRPIRVLDDLKSAQGGWATCAPLCGPGTVGEWPAAGRPLPLGEAVVRTSASLRPAAGPWDGYLGCAVLHFCYDTGRSADWPSPSTCGNMGTRSAPLPSMAAITQRAGMMLRCGK